VNWGVGKGVRWNDTFDGFVHGLRAVHVALGKGKEKEGDARLVIVGECAEKLIPELMVPLTRLAELVRHFVVVVVYGPTDLWRMMLGSHGRRSDHRGRVS